MKKPQKHKNQRLREAMEELREKYPAEPTEEVITLVNYELDLSEVYQRMNQDSLVPQDRDDLLDLPPMKDAGTGLCDTPPYAINGRIVGQKEEDNNIVTRAKSFNYEPLWATMKALEIDFDDLKKQARLGARTVDKLINGERVMISVIAKICLVLGCDLSDVVGLNYEWDIEKDNRDI